MGPSPVLGPQGAARFNLIGNIQPVREDSTRSEGVESSRSGVTPHRQQASSRIWRSTTSPARVLHAQTTQRCTRYVAVHPLRRDAPDQKGCNAYGSGAPPPTTGTTADNSSPQTPTVRLGRSHTASTCSPRLRTRGATPVTSRNTRYVAMHPIRRGVMPTDRVHRLIGNKHRRG